MNNGMDHRLVISSPLREFIKGRLSQVERPAIGLRVTSASDPVR
jgi:hypothetical protein